MLNRLLPALWLSITLFPQLVYSASKVNEASISVNNLGKAFTYTGSNGEHRQFQIRSGLFARVEGSTRIDSQESLPHRVVPAGFIELGQSPMGDVPLLFQREFIKGFNEKRLTSHLGLTPVLTDASGRGNVILEPEFIIRLVSANEAEQYAEDLAATWGLKVVSRMLFTDHEFVLGFPTTALNTGPKRIFELAAALMAQPGVAWAEPQMASMLQRDLLPNDPKFREQWPLYNWGKKAAKCDADTDVAIAWDLLEAKQQTSGLYQPIIAMIDDGFDLSHPDLASVVSPQAYFQGQSPAPQQNSDNHGTAMAGLAVAKANNNIGIAGSAYNAKLLPIRLPFNSSINCTTLANAIRYAGKYSDVISASWHTADICRSTLDSAISDVVNGNISGARRGNKGTPFLASVGNNGVGWQKKTVNVTAGSHTYKWQFSKDGSISRLQDSVWVDDIQWPNGNSTNFSSGSLVSLGFSTFGNAAWSRTSGSNGNHIRGSSGWAMKSGTISNNGFSAIQTSQYSSQAGTLSYWVWVSSEPLQGGSTNGDPFQFYIDGVEQQSHTGPYMDVVDPIQSIEYPASNSNVIAVGASTDGGISGQEERANYSQNGAGVDVIAPSHNDNQSLVSIDRRGSVGYAGGDYVNLTSAGTSASTAITAGIVANLIAYDRYKTATQIKSALITGAEKVYPYSTYNTYTGHGRVNLFRSLKALSGASMTTPVEACTDPDPDDFLLLFLPAILSGIPK